jgi:hypothetical protein
MAGFFGLEVRALANASIREYHPIPVIWSATATALGLTCFSRIFAVKARQKAATASAKGLLDVSRGTSRLLYSARSLRRLPAFLGAFWLGRSGIL